jgi:hypothetical protein
MAAASFREPAAWHGKAVELAGDTPNFVEVAAALGAALSRDVTYRQIPPEALDGDIRPKLGTQRWLEDAGWPIDLGRLLQSYPFTARSIATWAGEHAGELGAVT